MFLTLLLLRILQHRPTLLTPIPHPVPARIAATDARQPEVRA